MYKQVTWLLDSPSFGQVVRFDAAPQDLFGEVARYFGTTNFDLCNFRNLPASIADLTYFQEFWCFPKTRHHKVFMYSSQNDLHPDFVVPVSQHDSLSTIKEKVFKIKGVCCTRFEPRWGSLVRPEDPTCAADFEYPHGFIVHHEEEQEDQEDQEDQEVDQEEQKVEQEDQEEQEEEEEEEEEEDQEVDQEDQEKEQESQEEEDQEVDQEDQEKEQESQEKEEEEEEEEEENQKDQDEQEDQEEEEQQASCASTNTQERRARWTCTIC